jgi:hypothetical protein
VGEAANAIRDLEDLMNEPDEPVAVAVPTGKAIEGEWTPL